MAIVEQRMEIYETVDRWKKDCLLDDKSLLWPGESIWTRENISRFRTVFIDRPDETGDSFNDKLKKQLANESDGVYKFVIELLFVYYVYPTSISYKTKINKLEMIASWKNIDFDSSLPVFESLVNGIGSAGPFYNTNIYYEVSFLFWFVDYLKNQPLDKRITILESASELKSVAEDVRNQVGKRVQIQHIILHLLLPSDFERIASWGHKSQIIKAFSDYIPENATNDMDEQLFIIREKLENEYADQEFDFYIPEVLKRWQETRKQDKPSTKKVEESRSTESVIDESGNIPVVNFEVEPLHSGLIFEDGDLLIDQITTALRKGKHIILTGPPGTGKSKLASRVCEMYDVEPMMVTAASNWSTYETIGGYRPDREGNLYFDPGIFLKCIKNEETNLPGNKWLIIDEINRADIDKAFGSLFSVLTGDEVTLPFQSKNGQSIVMKPQGELMSVEPNDHTYVIPKDWRIIATMNTVDKASLYEMSYAFMRRFAFIPVGIPKEITNDLIEQYLAVWGMETYPNVETLAVIWRLINQYRKIGPAIIEDIARYTQENDDFTSAIILYVLPQFEGLSAHVIKEFISQLVEQSDAIMERQQLDNFVDDFFDVGVFG